MQIGNIRSIKQINIFIEMWFFRRRRGQVKTTVMEHFNGILFHNKQHTNQSINQSINIVAKLYQLQQQREEISYNYPISQLIKVNKNALNFQKKQY